MKKKQRPRKPQMQSSFGEPHPFFRRRRTKSDWAGIHLSDAFKPHLEFYIRIPAQRLFYKAVRKVQMIAAREANVSVNSGFKPDVKPQLAPCYTTYPPALASYAAIGLTGFLEFQTRVKNYLLRAHLYEYLENPAEEDRVDVEPEDYQRLAEIVTDIVETRLILRDLCRLSSLWTVEMYRLFAACQQKTNFRSVTEILNAVILYGDVFPASEKLVLHPLTRALLTDLTAVSRPFFEKLGTEDTNLLHLGIDWVKGICRCLAKYLENYYGDVDEELVENEPKKTRLPGLIRNWFEKTKEADKKEPVAGNSFPPLDEPQPPALFGSSGLDQQIAQSACNENPMNASKSAQALLCSKPLQDSLKRLMDYLTRACRQRNEFEEIRSDLLEKMLGSAPFHAGPMEGNPVEGHEVTVQFGNEKAVAGEIFDRAIELSDDFEAYDKLMAESQPVIDALREVLYPNMAEVPETERFRSSGSLDPARLAISQFHSAVFHRYRIRKRGDKRGRPVLLIACDASGSLNASEMKMAKVLATSWLNASARRNVQILAGFYHSRTVAGRDSGPLVEWAYHPLKTVCTGRKDATRAVVSLPNFGTGVQSDTLSLAFMLQEAQQLAKGKMVYLILITDCLWNRSLDTDACGEEEVYSFFENLYQDPNRRIHTTMVALGNPSNGIEHLLDKVILVPADQLEDYAGVASQVGTYVASVMKERRFHIKR
ncbi:IS110 family transposase [bacterium]|nr:IS110 family transposase [bacterium]